MPVQALGHTVLNVRHLDRAEEFYQGVLGMPIVGRTDLMGGMTFFSLGNHHDFAIHAVGDEAPGARDPMGAVGLAHVAFKVGDSLDDLKAMRDTLEANSIKVEMAADHEVTASLYISDPDGNCIELYVDTSDIWKRGEFPIALKPLEI